MVAADIVAGSAGSFPQLVRAIDPVVVVPQLLEHRCHDRVSAGPCRGCPGLGVVVGARGHRHACAAQDGADGLDPELAAVGVDEVN